MGNVPSGTTFDVQGKTVTLNFKAVDSEATDRVFSVFSQIGFETFDQICKDESSNVGECISLFNSGSIGK